jgi:hypothetical protein
MKLTKSDLRTGMLVENAEGNVYVVLLGTQSGDIIGSSTEDGVWNTLDNFRDDLSSRHSNLSIVRVVERCLGWSRNIKHELPVMEWVRVGDKLLSKSDDVIEMTLGEVEEKLGMKVKIVTKEK